MTQLLFLGASLNVDPFVLGPELARRDEVGLVRFNVASMVDRLREATAHRATVWQGVGAKPVDWIDPALERFGQALAAALVERVRAKFRRDVPVVANSHGVNPSRIELLARLFPAAKFLHVVRDGAVPMWRNEGQRRSGKAPTPLEAWSWATNWATFVEPPARLAAALGERLLSLRAEEIDADRDAAVARILDWLHVGGPRRWLGPWPEPEPRLAGDELQCFAACAPARAMLAHYGYDVPEPGPACERYPQVVAELARNSIAERRFDDAESLLQRALRTTPERLSAELHETLGDLHLARGRETEAVHAWLRSIQHGSGLSGAWPKLLARHQRPETLAVAEFARLSPQLETRAALARWLVARGLDAEAAEIVASVEHQAWR